MCSHNARVGVLGIIGALLIAVGAVLLVYFPVIVQNTINKEISLKPDSRSYRLWQDPPVPLRIEFRFFNVTNYDDYINGRAKAKLQEVGPYTYSEKWLKEKVTWNDNGTISYVQPKTFFFERELSSGPESDMITTMNVPMLMAAKMFANAGAILKFGLSAVFASTNWTPLLNATVGELLWDGYNDTIMTTFKAFMPDAPYPHAKFAFFYERNGSTDGIYTVHTGDNLPSEFTIIDKWNGKDELDVWDRDICNAIDGTVGETFPPNVDRNRPLRFFIADMCRSFQLGYSHPVEHSGIDGLRFEASPSLFANGTDNPANECFDCPNGICLLSGAFNISACKWGAPVAISLPHFFMGDPWYQQQLDGLTPNKSLHQFYVDVEPQTGFVLDVNVRIQINAVVPRVPNLAHLDELKSTVVPIFWFTQTAGLTPEIVATLTMATKTSHLYGKLIYYTLFAVGIVLLLLGVLYYTLLVRRKRFKA